MNEHRKELDALLVQRASQGLNPGESRRLDQLLAEFPDVDEEWADRVVGELEAEAAAPHEAALSPKLREALLAGGPEGSRDDSGVRALPLRSRVPVTAWAGWAIAAAVAGLWIGQSGPPVELGPTFSSVAALSDAMVVEWVPGADATGAQVTGEVVWSSTAQAGLMRFRGLAANMSGEYQYQLWIFDEGRDPRYPVDGGVFDMPVGSAEVEVPIQAKLAVSNPTLFAVTVERPGGVVVSGRERISTLAQVGD